MNHWRTRRVGAVALLITLWLASCSSPAAPAETSAGAAAALPACAGAGPSADLPSEFPSTFPLPPGTAITASQTTAEAVLVVDGIVPADLESATAFFLSELPAAGFALGFGDGEFDEAESAFSGNGYQGQFKVRSILNCADAVTLKLVIAKHGE